MKHPTKSIHGCRNIKFSLAFNIRNIDKDIELVAEYSPTLERSRKLGTMHLYITITKPKVIPIKYKI